MAKQIAATPAPRIERSVLMSTGIAAAEVIDATPDVVIGFRAARNPLLVQARKASNEARIAALTAELLEDL